MADDDTAAVKRAIADGESETVEFKQQWWDLEKAEGKAKLTKSVLALANSVDDASTAYLLIGVDDDGKVVGVNTNTIPSPETVSNILANYVQPPANTKCRHVRLGRHTISILEITGGPFRPYHAVRQHDGILQTNVVYGRRDRTIGVLTLAEVERLIRQKGSNADRIGREPLQFGFLDASDLSSGRPVVVRIANVSSEPVSMVTVIFDVRTPRYTQLFYRTRRLTNANFAPGEVREVELTLREVDFYLAEFDFLSGKRRWTKPDGFGGYVGDRWFDLTLHVEYRNQDDFIVQRRCNLSVDS